MPTYDPTDHPLLSAAAARLEPEVLLAHAEAAESILGLSGTSYDRETATIAVVYQINHVLALGDTGHVVTSESRGGRSVSYRDGDTTVSPMAARIASRLASFPVITGFR